MSLQAQLDEVAERGWAVKGLHQLREGGWACALYPAWFESCHLWSSDGDRSYSDVMPTAIGQGEDPSTAIDAALHVMDDSGQYTRFYRLEEAWKANIDARQAA